MMRLEIASINVWSREEDNLSGGGTIFLFQTGRCVEDYVEEFLTTSHQALCGERTLMKGFRVGLDEEIQILMPSGDPSWCLAQYVDFALCIAGIPSSSPLPPLVLSSSQLSPLVPSSSPSSPLVPSSSALPERPPVPAPRQRPPGPAPRQRPPVPAPHQHSPVPTPRQRPPVPSPRKCSPFPPLVLPSASSSPLVTGCSSHQVQNINACI